MKRVYYHCPPARRPKVRKPEEKRRKVAIIGSSGLDFRSYVWLYKMLDRATFALDDPIILVRGGSSTVVDRYVMNWASSNWLMMRVYYPEKDSKESRKKRDGLLLSHSDNLVVLSGGCQWTARMIEDARSMGVKVRVYTF